VIEGDERGLVAGAQAAQQVEQARLKLSELLAVQAPARVENDEGAQRQRFNGYELDRAAAVTARPAGAAPRAAPRRPQRAPRVARPGLRQHRLERCARFVRVPQPPRDPAEPQPDLVQRRVYGDRVAQQAARPLEALAGLATATQIQLRLPGARVKDVSGSLHRVSPRASSAITLYQRFAKPRHSGSERLHRLA